MATSTLPAPASAASPAGARIRRAWIVLATLIMLLFGGLEGWYGKTDSGDVYGSDAVQYLDIARNLTAHNWHSVLNPLWSQGYPALLAFTHTLLPITPEGDWLTTRLLNFLIFAFCWFTFCLLLAELNRLRQLSSAILLAATTVFFTAQVCLDQVSRVGPDQLVAALFFLACVLLLRLRRAPTNTLAALLGLTLGVGFLVKAVFLVLGCAILAVTFLALRQRRRVLPSAAIFAAIVLLYGAALTHAVGRPTLGEAGSLNYAWHVNRLAKWVHWQGGAEPGDKAWLRSSIARFAQWETNPPDFGTPTHPTQQIGTSPTILIFNAPVQATYTPYYDPAYFYEGYHHFFRWRYQLIALGKNTADLLQVLLTQPITYALFLILISSFSGFVRSVRLVWPLALCAAMGVALYLPVHLEGRYLSAFLAVLALLLLVQLEAKRKHRTALLAILFFSAVVGIGRSQAPIWSRAVHRWSPCSNAEWRTADAVLAAGPARGSQIGMISWTPNLHADWAFMAGLRITGEIATGPDEAAFWASSAARQTAILEIFHQAGATAVLTQDPPRNINSQWQQLPNAPIWIHRF